MNEQKQKIREFLRNQVHTVICTVDSESNCPESALVGFSETEDLEIIFGTFNDSRKYKHLQKNPQVSFVIGYEDGAIQYEGLAQEVSGGEVEHCAQIHAAKIPSAAKYKHDPRQRYFKVTPHWLRFTDYSEGEEVFEIDFS